MPAAYTAMLSVQVSDFEDNRLLIQHDRLLCDFCSSGQRFACSFLQIPPRGGHPCRPANTSPCRVCRGLDFDKLSRIAPPSECALPGAPKKKQSLFEALPVSYRFRFRSTVNTNQSAGYRVLSILEFKLWHHFRPRMSNNCYLWLHNY